MSWKKLIFKQNQLIHVGFGKWGVVKETAVFIPGQTMWGALTNFYFSYLKQKGKDIKGNYEDIKKTFEVISNFFPSFDGKNFLRPNYKNGEFYLGDFSENEFRLYFVDTTLRTSVVPIERRAKDGSLYEVDCILPSPKFGYRVNGFKDSLYWIGIIRCRDEEKKFLEKGLTVLVGGDTRYGLGELELIEVEDISNEELKDWNVEESGEEIMIYIEEDKSILNYLELNNKISSNWEFYGESVIIPEFNFRENVPKIDSVAQFITPGSKILNESLRQKGKLKKGKLYISS